VNIYMHRLAHHIVRTENIFIKWPSLIASKYDQRGDSDCILKIPTALAI